MDLYEVEGKLIFNEFNIKTEPIKLFDNIDPDSIEYPVVLKGQYLSGKRGKAGAIKVANDERELFALADIIKIIQINGYYPAAIHVAPYINVYKEHYLGITLDRKSKSFVLLYADQGGIDVEELAKNGQIESIQVRDENIDEVAYKLSSKYRKPELKKYVKSLYELVIKRDCLTAEINPLGELEDGSYFAMDSKIVIDDNAWYRQKDNIRLLFERCLNKTVYEQEAESYGLSFVNLFDDGDIGVIAGGAGIGMATVDSIKYYGLKPFNFCDLGGGVTSEKTYHALRLLLEIEDIHGILINIFGGVNNCLDMAKGICRAIDEIKPNKKIVIKSRGFNQEEGWKLYDERNIIQVRYGTTDDAVKKLKALLEDHYD